MPESLLGIVVAERELIEPEAIITAYIGEFQNRYKQRIELQVNGLPTGLKIYVVRHDIELAFANILLNATVASHDGSGTIIVRLQ